MGTLDVSDNDDTNDITGVSVMNDPKETTPSPHHQPIIPPQDPRLHLSHPSLASTSHQPLSEGASWLLSSIRKAGALHLHVHKHQSEDGHGIREATYPQGVDAVHMRVGRIGKRLPRFEVFGRKGPNRAESLLSGAWEPRFGDEVAFLECLWFIVYDVDDVVEDLWRAVWI